jgi:hypothetical protein
MLEGIEEVVVAREVVELWLCSELVDVFDVKPDDMLGSIKLGNVMW